MKKNVLITGGAGFIGSFLADELIKQGHNVILFDNLEPQVHQGNVPEYINKRANFVRGDVTNYDELKKQILNVDTIFHFGARVGVGQSMYKIKEYVKTNSLGTANLLHLVANENHNIKKIIVASSMTIYGEGSYYCKKCEKKLFNVNRTNNQLINHEWEPKCPVCNNILNPVPTKESAPLLSKNVYAITKKTQEQLVLNVCKAYGIPSAALRIWNTYGPRQSLNNPYTGAAAIFISRIKNNKPPLIFEDGQQSRDFVSVHDVVQAAMLIMKDKIHDHEAFNVGSGETISIKKLAQILIKIYGSKLKPKITNKYRKGDIRHCSPYLSKIKMVGYTPKVTLEKGMKELVEWSRKQESKDDVNKAYNELKDKNLV